MKQENICLKDGKLQITKTRRANRKFEPHISPKLLQKLQTYEHSGQLSTTCHSPQSPHCNSKISLATKLLPVSDATPPGSLSKKAKILLQQQPYPPFLTRHLATTPDAETLLLDKAEFRQLSPGMQRYWQLKSKVMDHILLYQYGDWYVLYYEDLLQANKHIDLQVIPTFMWQLVGFHSS